MNYSSERPFDASYNPLSLTPSQRLALLEQSQAVRRHRVKATKKVFGTAFLMLASAWLAACTRSPALVLGAIMLGAVFAAALIWSGLSDVNLNWQLSAKPEVDPLLIRDIDQRLANLEMILSYEEKLAARNRSTEGSQD